MAGYYRIPRLPSKRGRNSHRRLPMRYPRLAHGHCWDYVDVFENLFQDVVPPSAIPDFRATVYEALWDLLDAYQAAVDRQHHRLHPAAGERSSPE
jgi:hypothetical protein